MLDWMILPLKRYADFQGRSRRKEYWSFILLTVIVYVVLLALMLAGGFPMARLTDQSVVDPSQIFGSIGIMFWVGAVLLGVFVLAIFIPTLAVVVRRLHDRDLSGWWYLGAIVAGMIPLVGFLATIALFVVLCLEGTRGPNRFGPDPKDPNGADIFA